MRPIVVEGAAARDVTSAGGAGRWEWIEPDGLGGWAMGTVAGPRTRRYHGLLCVATRAPRGRMMLVNGLGETFVDLHGERALDAHFYPGVVYPDGYARLERYTVDPWPTWTYALDGGHLVREIVVLRGRPGTIVRWHFRSSDTGNAEAQLRVRPFLTGRDCHALHHENPQLDPSARVTAGRVELEPYAGAVPGVRLIHDGEFRAAPDWYRRVEYPVEAERGLDHSEDMFSPGELRFALGRAAAYLHLMPADADPVELGALPGLLEDEAERRSGRTVFAATEPDPVGKRLVDAAEAFLVETTRPRRGLTVIAGYPWFTDWGRDTFISARGLALAFGPRVERELLLAWEPFVVDGLIPNRFPEHGEGEYNAVDASLWYALACARHVRRGSLGDASAFETDARFRLTGAVRRIIEGYLSGTHRNIHVDDDGLVHAAAPGLQLTWMDAKIGDRVVTARAGKPIEVQALWVATLEAAARLFLVDDPHFSGELVDRAAWARSSFAARYWCEARGYLYDVLDGPGHDDTLRPNQLYALGLTRPLVDPDRARRALEAVERELLLPIGLRSRAPGPGYRGRMIGTQAERDGAYHEGTAWPFLLGIYADACRRVRGRVPPGILSGLLAHLEGRGLGQIAEVFDGDPPHTPRGCPAQAWSVAEALRIHLGAIAED